MKSDAEYVEDALESVKEYILENMHDCDFDSETNNIILLHQYADKTFSTHADSLQQIYAKNGLTIKAYIRETIKYAASVLVVGMKGDDLYAESIKAIGESLAKSEINFTPKHSTLIELHFLNSGHVLILDPQIISSVTQDSNLSSEGPYTVVSCNNGSIYHVAEDIETVRNMVGL